MLLLLFSFIWFIFTYYWYCCIVVCVRGKNWEMSLDAILSISLSPFLYPSLLHSCILIYLIFGQIVLLFHYSSESRQLFVFYFENSQYLFSLHFLSIFIFFMLIFLIVFVICLWFELFPVSSIHTDLFFRSFYSNYLNWNGNYLCKGTFLSDCLIKSRWHTINDIHTYIHSFLINLIYRVAFILFLFISSPSSSSLFVCFASFLLFSYFVLENYHHLKRKN